MFKECKFKGRTGGAMLARTTRVSLVSASLVRTQMGALQDWADLIHEEKLIATRVDHDAEASASADDAYWLAKPTDVAFAVPEDMINSGDQFEEGWLVVPIKWYNIIPGTERTYALLDKPHLLLVSTTVRLSGLKFATHKKNRNTITTDTHERILAAL